MLYKYSLNHSPWIVYLQLIFDHISSILFTKKHDFSNIKKPATYAFAGFNLALAFPKSSIGVSAV